MFYLFLILIFIRPFISSLISPYPSFIHSGALLFLLTAWIIAGKFSLKKLSPIKYPLIFFYVALIVSIVFSHHRMISVAESYKYFIPLLILWAVSNIDDKKKNMIVDCLLWAGFIISLLALRQYFFSFDDTLRFMAEQKINDPEAVLILQRRRVFAPFVTPDVLAGYLIMILPLMALLRKKIYMAIPAFLALLLTRSLGGLISMLLALWIYLYANGKFNRKAMLGLAGLLLIVITVVIIRHVDPDQNLNPLFSLTTRLGYWRDTLFMIKDHLLTGVGIGNFNLCVCRYTHNAYLQFWAETGILGACSLLWLVFSILRKNKQLSILSMATMAFLIHNFMEFTFFLPETAFLWWIIAGLSLFENEASSASKAGSA
jgi:O-antigen ligase